MIDIIFLLLIFFLVAAKWRPNEDFLPFRLPTAVQASLVPIVKPEPLIIKIFATPTGCQVQIGILYNVKIRNDNIESDMAVLMQKLRQAFDMQKRFTNDPVEIVCSSDVKWDSLAKIYNLFYGAGLSDITFRMTE